MPKGVYPCFRCGGWFESVAARKSHICGQVVKKNVEEEKVSSAEEEVKVVSSEEIKEDADFNRDEAIQMLKDSGVINDKRSVSRKSDEELMKMLEESRA